MDATAWSLGTGILYALLSTRGFTQFEFGVVALTQPIGVVFGTVPGGWLTHRIGARRLLMTSEILGAVMVLGWAFYPVEPLVPLYGIVWGFCNLNLGAGTIPPVGSHVPRREEGRNAWGSSNIGLLRPFRWPHSCRRAVSHLRLPRSHGGRWPCNIRYNRFDQEIPAAGLPFAFVIKALEAELWPRNCPYGFEKIARLVRVIPCLPRRHYGCGPKPSAFSSSFDGLRSEKTQVACA